MGSGRLDGSGGRHWSPKCHVALRVYKSHSTVGQFRLSVPSMTERQHGLVEMVLD